jgi:FtsP/CotA-like multicopper oxidase with cupredoxin domain
MARSEAGNRVSTEGHDKELVHFDLESATGRMDDNIAFKLPEPSQEPIVIYTKTEKLALNSYHPKSYINRTSWSPQTDSDTGLRRPLISLPRRDWDRNQLIPYIPLPQNPKNNDPSYGNYSAGTCIDIVVNNLDDGAHPFHLHGHSLWVLRSHRAEDRGWGSFNPYSTTPSNSDHASHFHLNTRNPIRRDTISVPRRGHVVIRLWTDNKGIWMLHCHILVHQASGMAMGLQIGGDVENKGSS